MEKFLLENETDFLESMKINKDDVSKEKHTQYTTRKFYYEAYVRKVLNDNKKHFTELMAEFKIFVDEFKNKKLIEKDQKA